MSWGMSGVLAARRAAQTAAPGAYDEPQPALGRCRRLVEDRAPVRGAARGCRRGRRHRSAVTRQTCAPERRDGGERTSTAGRGGRRRGGAAAPRRSAAARGGRGRRRGRGGGTRVPPGGGPAR